MLECEMGDKYTYVVLELCESDLKQVLVGKGEKLSEDDAILMIQNLVEAFKILVKKQYIHRDLKPENILIKDKKYKLADYGFVKKVKNIDM